MTRITLLIILLSMAGCQTNPPDPNEDIFSTGRVFISSDIPAAEIFVDNSSTGKFTPDTVIVNSGTHLLSLRKTGYLNKDTLINVQENSVLSLSFHLIPVTIAKLIILEDFANVSCNPCVTSNKIIHSLDTYTYKNKIAVIKYPTWWPGANDPFYLAAKAESDKRIGYYNVIVAPTVIIDGIKKPSPLDSLKIKEAVEAQLILNPGFDIEVTMNITGDLLTTDISVTFIDTAGLNFDNLVLHTVIVEKEIEFASPPGSNGETNFYHVMRNMLPSADGEQLINNNHVYQRSLYCKSIWNKSKLRVVAFIQNKSTREILQAGINY
jgi:hypothetical protein